MSRKNYKATSNKSSKREISYDTKSFGSSVIKGVAASRVPNDGLADAYDIIVYPDEIIGREGCSDFGVSIPAMDDRAGYTASKAGDVITAPSNTFTEVDVSNYFVFPGSPNAHYEIIGYISDTQVRAHTIGDHSATIDCYLRSKTNLMVWHKIARKYIFIWGQDVYVSKWDLLELVRCRVISRDLPNNAVSGYDDFDRNSGIIFNSNGMFKIDLEPEVPKVIKINTPIPNIAIPDIVEIATSEYNYHYLYSSSRLFEIDNLVNRLSPSKIEQESGTNIWDETYRDYADIYTDEPIGEVEAFYGRLVCVDLGAPYDVYSGWVALGNPGSFRINMYYIDDAPGVTYEIVVDFSNVTNMKEVGSVVQFALRDFYSDATCDFVDGHFVITTGRKDFWYLRQTEDGVAAGTTNISTIMGGSFAAGATVENPYIRTNVVVGPLYVPNVPNTTPQEYQWHLTHLPVYRTKDLSGRYKIDTEVDQFNSPNDFVWLNDVRTCGAFWGYAYAIWVAPPMRLQGYFFAEQGEFEIADVGSVLEFDDGTRFEILLYVHGQLVIIAYLGYSYGDLSSPMLAAAIGNGRVFRASQTENLVTRTHGGSFSSSDVRKPIKWATGYYSYITEFIDSDNVRVADTQGKTVMGMTMDPVYRYYNDSIDDDTLNTRLTRLKLKNRYWKAMPNGNVGKVVPGLIFTAARGDGELNYGQMPDTLEYLHGYHDRGYQTTKKIKDDIQFMWLFQDILIIWTSRKTWRWPTESYEFIVNQYTKDAILQISGIEITDEDRGCFDWGSIEPIGNGNVKMLTSEQNKVGWRSYNGYQYGPNDLELLQIGKERIPDIQKLQQATRAVYDGRVGLLLFGRE